MMYGRSDVTTDVYRVTAQNAVGLLECAATHGPTGLVAVAQGRCSAEVTALAMQRLAGMIEEHEKGERTMADDRTDQLDSVTLAGGPERGTVARVYGFMVVLRAADLSPLDEDEYWERPWKWDREYRHWIAAGRPDAPDLVAEVTGRAVASLAWERFVRSCLDDQ